MASIKKTKGVFIPPVVTPRRSPRLAARNLLEEETTKQVTPVRETLKKFILTRGESKALLDELQSFIKCSEKYRLLEATSITAEIEFNVIKTYLVITRSIKSYDEHIGPYDGLKIIAEEYKMIAYYKVLQEDIVELPVTSNKITAALDISNL